MLKQEEDSELAAKMVMEKRTACGQIENPRLSENRREIRTQVTGAKLCMAWGRGRSLRQSDASFSV
jgi:hypothetical protein